MQIHYFQRYHSKENVDTSNTMLMLSRLYNYNADKFFSMLNSLILGEDESPEITFDLQVVGDDSVPDAVISQKSFKIVVETKLYNQFYKQQLVNQLYKLPDVCSIKEFSADNSISCELLLIKMENDPATRDDIRTAAEAFGAVTVDYSKNSIMFRLADSSQRIDDFINIMRDYKILEICRTGSVSLEKGSTTIRQTINF